MKVKPFVKKIGINEEDFDRIREAVVNAEKKTSGEIACAVAKESNRYSAFEIFWAFALSIVCAYLLLIYASDIQGFLSSRQWGELSPKTMPLVFVLVITVLSFAFYCLLNLPFFDNLIVPSSVKVNAVQKRAMLHFVESGVYKTTDHTGILIFISVLERRVVIFADEGINAKIEQQVWDKLCGDLIESIKAKKTSDGLVAAINTCGDLLAEHFPIAIDDVNELPDGLVVLD